VQGAALSVSACFDSELTASLHIILSLGSARLEQPSEIQQPWVSMKVKGIVVNPQKSIC
jgi:hypothetical protein